MQGCRYSISIFILGFCLCKVVCCNSICRVWLQGGNALEDDFHNSWFVCEYHSLAFDPLMNENNLIRCKHSTVMPIGVTIALLQLWWYLFEPFLFYLFIINRLFECTRFNLRLKTELQISFILGVWTSTTPIPRYKPIVGLDDQLAQVQCRLWWLEIRLLPGLCWKPGWCLSTKHQPQIRSW